MTLIKSLEETTFDDLYDAFSEAFKGYISTWTKDELAKTLHRRSYHAELSFGAFEDNALVSFTLNSLGMFNDIQTAYDAGTGTIAAFRGKGLATQIFNYAVPFLKEKGVQQYLLEVLTQNTQAISIYTKQGFKVNRELNVFQHNKKEILSNSKVLTDEMEIREIDFANQNEMADMWDFYPSWQNNFNALLTQIDDFKMMGAFKGNELVGYGIIEVSTGDIPQLAVCRKERRKGIGSAILKELGKLNQAHIIKMVNTDSACENITAFIENNGLPKFASQYEMIKEL